MAQKRSISDIAEQIPVSHSPLDKKRNSVLTKEDAELYDRQIRIWGLNSQQRLRNSKILIVGVNSLSSEVIKNLILAGIGSLTILDDRIVTEDNVNDIFFLRKTDVGKTLVDSILKRAQILNPRVTLKANTTPYKDINGSYFLQFDSCCICNGDLYLGKKISELIHTNKSETKLWVSDVAGQYGFILSDLGRNYKYTFENKKVESDGNTSITNEIIDLEFPSLNEVLSTNFDISSISSIDTDKHLQKRLRKLRQVIDSTFLSFVAFSYGYQAHITRNDKPVQLNEKILPEDYKLISANKSMKASHEAETAGKEFLTNNLKIDPSLVDTKVFNSIWDQLGLRLGFVSAILGGMLAQDILKVLSGKGRPIFNAFSLNTLGFAGGVFQFPPSHLMKLKKQNEIINTASEEAIEL